MMLKPRRDDIIPEDLDAYRSLAAAVLMAAKRDVASDNYYLQRAAYLWLTTSPWADALCEFATGLHDASVIAEAGMRERERRERRRRRSLKPQEV